MKKNLIKLNKSVFLIGMLLAFGAWADRQGGTTAGGGSELRKKFLDQYAQENIIDMETDPAYINEVAPILKKLDRMLPDFAESLHKVAKSKIFIGIDSSKLPQAKEGDVKHEIANKLVAYQRGPLVWVLRKDFLNRAPLNERGVFYFHEILVGEKLRQSTMQPEDKDKIIAANLVLFDFKKNPSKYTPDSLREKLEQYGFNVGKTSAETLQISKTVKTKMQSIVDACVKLSTRNIGLSKSAIRAEIMQKYEEIKAAASRKNLDKSKLDLFLKEEYQSMLKILGDSSSSGRICRNLSVDMKKETDNKVLKLNSEASSISEAE